MANIFIGKKHLLLLIKTLGFVAFACWLYFGYCYFEFMNRPSAPEIKNGYVIPFLWKGRTVFISDLDKLRYDGSFYLSIFLFSVYAICYSFARRKLNDQYVFPNSETNILYGKYSSFTFLSALVLLLLAATISFLFS